MGNPYDEFELDDQPKEKSEGGQLRDKLEAALKLLKEKDKQLTELAKYKTESELSQFLKDVPPKFHKLAKRELAENPTSEGFADFVKEYGDLWGAEQEEDMDVVEAGLREAVDKISAAQREARNIQDEPFKMPTPQEFLRMDFATAQRLAEQARAKGK